MLLFGCHPTRGVDTDDMTHGMYKAFLGGTKSSVEGEGVG